MLFLLTFEIEEVAFASADSLALTNDDSGHDLLSQLGLTLLDRSKEEIANRAGGVPVKTSAGHGACDHVKVLGSSVVSTVHNRGNRQRVRDLQLDAVASSSSYKS